MKNLTRSTRLAVAPALLAAMALSACQDEAPSAAPPSPASPTAAQSGSGGGDAPTSEGTQEQPAEPSTAAPETSEPPSTDSGSSASGSGSGKCSSTDLFKITRGAVSPKAQSEPQKVKKEYGDGVAEVTIGKPKIDTSGGDSFFPGDGYQTVIVPVTIKAAKGSYVISELHFGLTDPSDQPCKRDVLNAVVPKADEIPVDTLQEGDSKSGKVGFAVPAGAKLSDYTVVYAENYSGGKADVAWKAG